METPLCNDDILDIENLLNVIELTKNAISSNPNCVEHLAIFETKKTQIVALKSLAILKLYDNLLPITSTTIRIKLIEITYEVEYWKRNVLRLLN